MTLLEIMALAVFGAVVIGIITWVIIDTIATYRHKRFIRDSFESILLRITSDTQQFLDNMDNKGDEEQ